MATARVDEVIAFYLPQFHPIPENDEFWEPGFTEWTNVRRATPLYPGHRQPRVPGELGYYDLRDPEVRAAQADLATAHGVTAFCYWRYWFGGRQLLERPFDEVVASGQPDLPFCVGWANESWTGVWHGAPNRVLVEQTYPGPDDHRRHFEALLPAFTDSRYLRVLGRPLVYILRPRAIPDLEATLELWRDMARDAGLSDLYLVGLYRLDGWVPTNHGFDGSVAWRLPVAREEKRGPTVVPYGDFLPALTSLADDGMFPCVQPQWDNTPRSERRGVVLDGATPELFRASVELAARKAQKLPPGQRLLWVKSWNEWAEGNMLEPDAESGRAYLEALRDGLAHPAESIPLAAAEGFATVGHGLVKTLGERLRVRAAGGMSGRRRRDPVPVLLCVDVEPDQRIIDGGTTPDLGGVASTYELMCEWRERAAAVTGRSVRINWSFRMDAQIEHTCGDAGAVATRSPAMMDDIQAAGDVLGIHPHAFRWDEERQTWYGDFADEAWMLHNLELAAEAFRRVFGRDAEQLRYGDSVLTDALVARAEELGIRYDLTLEPGRPERPLPEVGGELSTGLQHDWRRVPRQAYAPHPDDYRRTAPWGSRSITMVPLSSGGMWPGRSVRRRMEAVRHHGIAGHAQRDLLYMAGTWWQGPDSFDQMLRRCLVAQRKPYLALAVRSDRVRERAQWRRIERGLEQVLGLQEEWPLVFCSPDEAMEMLGQPPGIGAALPGA